MFRDSLSESSSHYSMLLTPGNGLAQNYRTCQGCSTVHHGHYFYDSSVWFRVIKEGNVLRSFYKPSHIPYWTPVGVVLSMNSISSNGYYVGIAVNSHKNNKVGSLEVSNIQLSRTCSSEAITQLQCDQASNCESGQVSGNCYNKGEVPTWEATEPVSSVVAVGSTMTRFGCDNTSSSNEIDGTTNKMFCDRTNLLGEPTGLVITPSHHRMSTALGLRVYASDTCPGCDPVSYIFEGRPLPTSDWVQISQGDLPWKTATTFPRNSVQGLDISSSYTSADDSFAFTEVSFGDPSDLSEYYQYKVTWTATRHPTQLALQVGEIEIPGLLGESPFMPEIDVSY